MCALYKLYTHRALGGARVTFPNEVVMGHAVVGSQIKSEYTTEKYFIFSLGDISSQVAPHTHCVAFINVLENRNR